MQESHQLKGNRQLAKSQSQNGLLVTDNCKKTPATYGRFW
ncbi:hypothetical protein M595_0271 [Lyngbya aestuarii BL J]|uniref:Uncharacterized protein n=1 Tax=Lyngbya aestuarii BL J TaxID=1348334 RepID=U7QP50_9CYAN|nr:hypothetical protein M595_0271 [Lyngbya aestuarii BL J]